MLRVLSLNLWNRSGPYARRRERIREWVERLDPDVIGFQEVLRDAQGDQAEDLLNGLGYRLAFAAASEQDEVAFGNTVASRWPIASSEVLRLPAAGSDESRCALLTSIDAPFGTLSFTCTHLNWKLHHGFVREQQVVALADAVISGRPRGGFPPIVVGDLNAEPGSDEIRYLTGFHSAGGRSAMFYDAWRVAGDGGPGVTWSNRNTYAAAALEPDRRIDYVLVGYPVRTRQGYGIGRIEACRVVADDERDGVWPSDHFGVYAELRTEPLPLPRWREEAEAPEAPAQELG